MSKLSKYARAAAVLVFTSGVDGFDQAVELYDEMGKSDEPVDDVLDKCPGVCRWSRLDDLDEIDWWEEVETLARIIDEAREHFKE